MKAIGTRIAKEYPQQLVDVISAANLFTWLPSLLGSDRIMTPSRTNQPIETFNGLSIGAMLCCEDMHGDHVRQLVASGAELLITIGNGMYFTSESALEQHFRIARFRAIEHRLPFLRCNSRGISALIAPSGRVTMQLPAMQDAAALLAVKNSHHAVTLCSKIGDVIPNGQGARR